MLAKELMRKGHTVTIIASSFRHNVGTDEISAEGQMWKKEILDGVPFVWIKTPPYKGNGLDRIWNMLCFGCFLDKMMVTTSFCYYSSEEGAIKIEY